MFSAWRGEKAPDPNTLGDPDDYAVAPVGDSGGESPELIHSVQIRGHRLWQNRNFRTEWYITENKLHRCELNRSLYAFIRTAVLDSLETWRAIWKIIPASSETQASFVSQ